LIEPLLAITLLPASTAPDIVFVYESLSPYKVIFAFLV